MTSVRDADRDGDTVSEPPWHERTSTVVGASVAALLALAIIYFLVTTVARQFNDPDPAPSYYVDPGGGSSSYSRSATTTTTTETITSTVPPVTTEINPGDTSTTTTTTDTSPNTNLPTTRRTTPSDDESGYSRRPRFNETRTFPRAN